MLGFLKIFVVVIRPDIRHLTRFDEQKSYKNPVEGFAAKGRFQSSKTVDLGTRKNF